MAEDKIESPTMDDGAAEPQTMTEAPKGNEDVDALMAKLNALGINSEEKLENTYNASKDVGKAWNQVGELKQQLNEMQYMLKQAQSNKPYQESNYDQYGDQPPVDLKKEIRNTLREFYMEDIVKPNQEMQKKFWKENQEIESDNDYQLVKETWNQFKQSPAFQNALMSGESQKDLYNKVVRSTYRELLTQTHNTLTGLNKKDRGDIPHIESGDGQSAPAPPDADERKDKLNKIVKGRESGDLSSDKAIENMVKTMLPADDPIFRF